MEMPLKIHSLQLTSPSICRLGFGGGCERVKDVSKKNIATFPANKSLASASTSYFKLWDTSYCRRNPTPACKSHLIANFAPASSAAYGLLLLGGGLFAYKKTGSKGSLLGGLSGATLMAAAYFLMQAPETKEIGDAITFGSALLFASVFGIRFASTRKVIPSGLLLAISIGVMMVSVSAYLQDGQALIV